MFGENVAFWLGTYPASLLFLLHVKHNMLIQHYTHTFLGKLLFREQCILQFCFLTYMNYWIEIKDAMKKEKSALSKQYYPIFIKLQSSLIVFLKTQHFSSLEDSRSRSRTVCKISCEATGQNPTIDIVPLTNNDTASNETMHIQCTANITDIKDIEAVRMIYRVKSFSFISFQLQ